MDSMGKREMAAVVGTDRRRVKRERSKGVVSGCGLLFSVSDSHFCQQPCPSHSSLVFCFFVGIDFLSLCSVHVCMFVSCAFRKNAVSVKERKD